MKLFLENSRNKSYNLVKPRAFNIAVWDTKEDLCLFGHVKLGPLILLASKSRPDSPPPHRPDPPPPPRLHLDPPLRPHRPGAQLRFPEVYVRNLSTELNNV